MAHRAFHPSLQASWFCRMITVINRLDVTVEILALPIVRINIIVGVLVLIVFVRSTRHPFPPLRRPKYTEFATGMESYPSNA